MAFDGHLFRVRVPLPEDASSYVTKGASTVVEEVLEEAENEQGLSFCVRFDDDHHETVNSSA